MGHSQKKYKSIIINELRLFGQVKRLYDDVKLYGTSCRVETSV